MAARLVAIPSDGPAHDERAVVEELVRVAASLGLPTGEVIAADPAHPNLLIRLTGANPGRRLILTSHTDTKPPGVETDPRSAVVREGRLHGLGSADAKGSVAAMLVAASAIIEAGRPTRGELILAFTADEESDGTRGLAHLASAGLLSADGAIVGEPSGAERSFDSLPVSARGFVGLTIRARGRRLHSGLADDIADARDPLRAIGRAVTELPALFRLQPLPARPVDSSGSARTRLTFTSLGGGDADGILADEAWARGEVRTRPGQTIAEIERAAGAALAALLAMPDMRGADLRLEVDPIDWPASAVDPTAPIVTALAAATEHVTGTRPGPGAFPGATEAHVLTGLGIPTVPAFGPGLLSSAHVPGESIAIDDLRAAVAIYARVAADFLA
ncbi:MAG TPA: M20/M25/M40 family metallo-hydrolase [Candidatus Limnocylindrales bacterium]|nr:M20/M25/M40 family metallo-hydrolase [Candidatus Limnocylindrales bacterium]